MRGSMATSLQNQMMPSLKPTRSRKTKCPHGFPAPRGLGPNPGHWSVPKSSGAGSRHQKRPFARQHALKRLPEPQGHGSFRPSFSSSTLSPWTTRVPRITCVSDGNPRRRLLIVSKEMAVRRCVRVACAHLPFGPVKWAQARDTAATSRFAADQKRDTSAVAAGEASADFADDSDSGKTDRRQNEVLTRSCGGRGDRIVERAGAAPADGADDANSGEREWDGEMGKETTRPTRQTRRQITTANDKPLSAPPHSLTYVSKNRARRWKSEVGST